MNQSFPQDLSQQQLRSHKGPITATHLLSEDILLAGHGYSLRIYEVTRMLFTNPNIPRNLRHTVRIFDRERIHGIASSKWIGDETMISDTQNHDTVLLVWGGKSIVYVKWKSLLFDFDVRIYERAAPDWILHGVVVPRHSPPSNDGIPYDFIVVTAHNAIYGVQCTDDETGNLIFVKLAWPERCMLYSASLTLKCSNNSLDLGIHVASGTIFGPIIYWSHQLHSDSGKLHSQTRVHKRLESHEGSIFGVALSDDLGCLVSCSDDRSIRLWNISQESSTEIDTSPGESGVSVMKESSIGWGHQARVWGVKFVNQETVNGIKCPRKIISWGEDATVRFWTQQDSCLNCTNVIKNIHVGKSIWSLDVSPSKKIFSTGGNDSGLATYPLPLSECDESKVEAIFDPAEIDKSTTLQSTKDKFKDYCILSPSKFLATTFQGKLLLQQFNKDNPWTELGQWKECESSSALSSWPGGKLAVIGSKDGKIALLKIQNDKVDNINWVKAHSSRIAKLLTAQTSCDKQNFLLSMSLERESTLLLHKALEIDGNYQLCETWRLEAPGSFVAVSFCIHRLSESNIACILGSRHGIIAIWLISIHGTNLSISNESQGPSSIAQVFYKRIHGEDAVTSIKLEKICNTGTGLSAEVWSTGRNGYFLKHLISIYDKTATLELVHESSPSLLHTIEGYQDCNIGMFNNTEELILYGFRGNEFVIWNETKGTEAAGGGHHCGNSNRSFEFTIARDHKNRKYNGLFVFSKGQKCHTVRFNNFVRNILIETPFHGREIKAVAVSYPFARRSADNSKRCRVVATGAEDTVIRFSTQREAGEIRTFSVQKAHSTGILHLEWAPCSEYLFSSGGVEELYCWKVNDFGGLDELRSLGVVKEAELKIEESNERDLDLRTLGLSVHPVLDEDLAIGFLVAAVYSDSSIKVFFYDREEKVFITIVYGFYKTSCLLHVKLFITCGRAVLLTAGTDGHITIYDIKSQLSTYNILPNKQNFTIEAMSKPATTAEPSNLKQPIFTRQLHQNSIKSLSLYLPVDNVALILTGGDDSAFALTELSFSDSNETLEVNSDVSISHPRAHASAITAVAILPTRAYNTLIFATASVDQRVKYWWMNYPHSVTNQNGSRLENRKHTLRCTGETYVCVPDIADMDYYYDDESGCNVLFVAGVGIDMLEVKDV